ncbi:hypothetical protein BDF22DRAFT_745461 [Syncephalis plumigaleata]|nr:hypothetical protein BDF22DRAFT_745461 [Syncephalis plumigaleata]
MDGLTVMTDQRTRTASLDMDRHDTDDKEMINDLHHNDDELEEVEEEEDDDNVQLLTEQQQQQHEHEHEQHQTSSQSMTSSAVMDGTNSTSNNATSTATTTTATTATAPHYHLPHTPQAQRDVIQASHVPYSAPSSSSITGRSMMDVSATTPGSSSASRTTGDLLTEREYKRKSGQSRSLWRERETRLLIEIAVNHLDELKSSAHNKGFLFGMFSDHLRQYGFDRSAEQCRWRWRNLKNEYRRQRAYRMALASGHEYTGPDIIESWPFYDELIYVLAVTANTTSVNLDVNEDTGPIKQDLDSLFRLLSAPSTTGDTTASQAESIIQQTVAASTSSHHHHHQQQQQQQQHRLNTITSTNNNNNNNSHANGVNGTNNGRSPSARPFKRTRLQSNQGLIDVDNTLTLDWLEQERARDRVLGEGLKERLDRLLELTERNTLATERMAAAMERWVELRDDHDLLLSTNDRV